MCYRHALHLLQEIVGAEERQKINRTFFFLPFVTPVTFQIVSNDVQTLKPTHSFQGISTLLLPSVY